MKVFGLVLVVALCLSTSFSQVPDMAVEIFRHGIRTPESTEYDTEGVWASTGYGELTAAGMRQQYILGAAFGQIYKDLLYPFNASKLYVQSTQENRTLMSALSQLYGIYNQHGPNLQDGYPAEIAIPPYNSDLVNKIVVDLADVNAAIPNNYQPLPIHSLQKQADFYLQSYLNCPNANSLFKKQQNDSKVQEVYAELATTVENLKKLHLEIDNSTQFDDLGDTVIADYRNQVTLPGGIDPTSEEFADLQFWAQWYEIYPTLNLPIQRQLFSGPILNSILQMFQQKRANTTPLNFAFYAAKETMLATILSALNITTPECLLENWRSEKDGKTAPNPNCNYPIFASNLIFEFYNDTTSPYVMFKYNGAAMPICNGQTSCPLNDFATYIQNITAGYDLNNFQKWCNANQTHSTFKGQKQTSSGYKLSTFDTVLLGVIALLLISLIVVAYKAKTLKDQHNKDDNYTQLQVQVDA